MPYQPETLAMQALVNRGDTTWPFEYDKLLVALNNTKADCVQSDTDTLRALEERNALRVELEVLKRITQTHPQ